MADQSDNLPSAERRITISVDAMGGDLGPAAVVAEDSYTARDAIDLLYPSEGFSNIALQWLENLGWCGRGEGGDFVLDHWVEDEQRILIDGRVPINTHGGSLSEGGTQGSGHLREAVHQLQGRAGDRQVPGATAALVASGGFYFNSQGAILRRDS